MSRVASEVWARLAGERPQGESLWARHAVPEITTRIVAALDVDSRRHLLVLLQGDEEGLEDCHSRGLNVTTRELVMPKHDPGRYLDITCQDTAGYDAFDLVGGEIADRLAIGSESSSEIIGRVLSKWRRFWGQASKQVLSYNEQLGLFAELWFLSVWLIPTVGTTAALDGWRGPRGSRHDFEWPSRSVEVKATTSLRGKIHHVNGLDQLAAPGHGELLFFSLRLRDEGGATNTLPAVVAKCRSAFATDPEALSKFEDALVGAGYLIAHEGEYAQVRLRIVEEGLFRVTHDFPKLTSLSFPRGLPAGVERVEYEINLEAYTHLRIASVATDMPPL